MQNITKIIKILLIEEDPVEARSLSNFFVLNQTAIFDVVRVRVVSEAREYTIAEKFDIILLDLLFPDKNKSLESLQQVKNIAIETPIIVLAEEEDREIALEALKNGAQDYILKGDTFEGILIKSIEYAIDRQKIVEELRCNEIRYREVVEDRGELICRFLIDGTLTFVNQAYCSYFDRFRDELIGDNFTRYIIPEDLSIVSGSLKSLNWKKPTNTMEYRIVDRLGNVKWLQWNNRSIFRGQEAIEYQSVGRDITDRKLAEQENFRLVYSLNESKEKFRLVTDSSPILMWMSDENGNTIFFNKSWLDFSGYNSERELKDRWWMLIHPDDRDKFETQYNLALERYDEWELEFRLLRHDGQYRWIFNTGVPRFDKEENFRGFILSSLDITKRKQAEELLTKQAKRDRVLAKVTQRIHESLDLPYILQTTIKTIKESIDGGTIFVARIKDFESSVFHILFQSDSQDNMDCRQCWPLDRDNFFQLKNNFHELLKGKSITVKNDSQGENIIATHYNGEPKNNISRDKKQVSFSVLLVPIISEKTLWGVLGIIHCLEDPIVESESVKLLEQISVHLAIAIKQSELYHQLELANLELSKLTVIDDLTGIANRRRFDEYLSHEWSRLMREKNYLSLILCDIDHFKSYNDFYGHVAGDLCLRDVAHGIAKVVKRSADLTARYGGEEFAIILPNTSVEGAENLARQICLKIQSLELPHLASPTDIYVTLSLGVAACIPSQDSSVRDLIETADSRLYQAKQLGRNRVVGH